jgi:hypothetical protein
LRDLPSDVLLAELEEITGGRPVSHWRGAIEDPRQWLHGYADLLQASWEVMEPIWRQLRPAFDREVERVAVAAARRALDLVLDNLHGDAHFDVGTFSFPDAEPDTFTMGSRSLVLMPMLAGPSALIARLDDPEAAWIGYPLPGSVDRPPAATGRRHANLMRFFLGQARAAILGSLHHLCHRCAAPWAEARWSCATGPRRPSGVRSSGRRWWRPG